MHHDRNLVREYGRKNAGEAADTGAEFKDVMAALAKRDGEIKAFAEKANAEIKATGQVAAETKTALDSLVRDGTALQSRLMEVEQKLARRGGGNGEPAVKSNGVLFTESEDFKAMKARGVGTASFAVKAVTSVTSVTTGTGGVGDAIVPQRLPYIVAPGQRTFTIRDLLMPGRTSSNAIEYVRESGFQNSAAPVAELALKPQSDLSHHRPLVPRLEAGLGRYPAPSELYRRPGSLRSCSRGRGAAPGRRRNGAEPPGPRAAGHGLRLCQPVRRR